MSRQVPVSMTEANDRDKDYYKELDLITVTDINTVNNMQHPTDNDPIAMSTKTKIKLTKNVELY